MKTALRELEVPKGNPIGSWSRITATGSGTTGENDTEICMTIPQSELQGLFPKFAAPLVNGEAATRFGEPVARQLAQTFWRLMIDGPVAEARLWKSFGESFTTDDVAMLRRCFEKEMKASVSPEQLTAIGEWYVKGEYEEFSVGDQVRVRHGTVDPDYPDLPLGGWAGTIVKIDEDGLCHILLNSATLDQIHPVYRKRCERDDLHIEILDMYQEDLDPDLGESLPVEQPTDIQTKPLDINDQQDRIRAALGVTTDDAVPVVEKATLHTYGEYLKAHLTFPFPATFSEHVGQLRDVSHDSGRRDVRHDFRRARSTDWCARSKAIRNVWEMPLVLLEVSKDDPNRQLLEDYRRWFGQWGDATPGHRTHRSNGHQDDEESEPSADGKTGRNDPCPCGSGKKFKKCCLRKQNGRIDLR